MKNKILLFYPKFTLLNYVIITESIFLPHYLFLKPAIYCWAKNESSKKMCVQSRCVEICSIFFAEIPNLTK